MPPEEFDIDTLSVAEILFILNGKFCATANSYAKFGTDLRTAWNELITKEDHVEVIGKLIGYEQTEPDWPEEFYVAIEGFFDFKIEKKKVVEGAIRSLNLDYEALKKKYKKKDDWNGIFEEFKKALEKYINRVAKENNIKPW